MKKYILKAVPNSDEPLFIKQEIEAVLLSGRPTESSEFFGTQG